MWRKRLRLASEAKSYSVEYFIIWLTVHFIIWLIPLPHQWHILSSDQTHLIELKLSSNSMMLRPRWRYWIRRLLEFHTSSTVFVLERGRRGVGWQGLHLSVPKYNSRPWISPPSRSWTCSEPGFRCRRKRHPRSICMLPAPSVHDWAFHHRCHQAIESIVIPGFGTNVSSEICQILWNGIQSEERAKIITSRLPRNTTCTMNFTSRLLKLSLVVSLAIALNISSYVSTNIFCSWVFAILLYVSWETRGLQWPRLHKPVHLFSFFDHVNPGIEIF